MFAPIMPKTGQRSLSPAGIILTVIAIALATLGQPALGQQGHSPATHSATPATGADNSNAEDWVMAAIRPELQESIRAAMPANLPVYEMSATLEPQAETGDVPTLTGHLKLTYVNTTDAPLDSLPFRLYANGPDDENDAQIVSDVTVDGGAVDVTLSVSDSVLDVPFNQPLDVGDLVVIDMEFASFLPIDSVDHYGIFGYGSTSGTWALAHWYPVIAGRDPSGGWMLEHPSRNGDAIFSDTALYDVTIHSEQGWELATTGIEFGETDAAGPGMVERRFASGPVRDFTIVADQDFKVATADVNGITVNSWFNPGQDRVGEAVLEYAIQSLEFFDDLLAPYPFRELDLMPVDMQGAAGSEFPGLIYMGLDYYTGNTDLATPNSLDFTVAHEVVHQWFYGLVGNNQYADAFIDEGITNYLSAQVYFEEVYGDDEAERIMNVHIRSPFERIIDGDGDVVVDTPTDEFDSGRDYVFAAYTKAPLGFEAIRLEIGDDAFFGALRDYVDEFSFLVAEPADLLAAFEASSGQDLQSLWDEWFNETNGRDALD
ncbi:MAG: M1 family metallopeptidase [Chloroflexota bacterium]|nr:M1 family metallopeptidase [Chloroflexota bacterium]